ncbi:hypothetical protein GCM10010964_09010 [Caldovatus sediminis]|uniref:DUF6468 domain-containing protein n=1 Tax=Caldovatus sediminis TaxID=2041189 RepID=A0A8J2Z8T0_9PROT|nr:DUF6468 domain-containing protein [Caldovatus sediminis]GGG23075.1 hypothetical protein GCM10010964_09010 [Caldovatus sediminis]
MSTLEWTLQLVLLVLLGAAIPFALRLERQLGALRRDRVALEGSAAGFQEATRMAEAAMVRLRAAAELAGRQVAERAAAAEPLRDDLRYLAERAEGLADRLEALVRAARPLAATGAAPAARPEGAAAEPAPERGEAGRDLVHALAQALPRTER